MGCPERRSGMPGSFSTVLAHMEPPSSRKQAKRVRLGPKRTLLGAPDVLGEPRGADLVPTTPDWPAWVGFMVTTHFDLASGHFHCPIFVRYHLNTRAGELPRSASSHFQYFIPRFPAWVPMHCNMAGHKIKVSEK